MSTDEIEMLPFKNRCNSETNGNTSQKIKSKYTNLNRYGTTQTSQIKTTFGDLRK